MQRRVCWRAVGAASLAVIVAGGAAPSPTPSQTEMRRLWEGGTWGADIATGGGGFMSGYKDETEYLRGDTPPRNPVPLDAVAQKNFNYIRAQLAQGRAIFAPYGQCHPAGMPYLLAFDTYGGAQAVVADHEIDFIYGTGDWRRIYIDGRTHPKPGREPDTYNGHSVGHWEGKTLVIDTTNIRGQNTVVEPDIPKAPGTRLEERYTPSQSGVMDVQLTMTNPQFTRPWVVKYHLLRNPKGVLVEHHCTDGNRYSVEGGAGLVMHGADGKSLEKAED